MTFVIHTYRSPMAPGLDVYIGRGGSIVTNLQFNELEEGATSEPCMSGKDGEEFLRAALNAAWDLGLRPDGYLDVRESMKATNSHLQDMRAIAFAKLNVEKPDGR